MLNAKSSPRGGVGKSFLLCFGISVGAILLLSLIGATVAIGLDDPTGSLPLISLIILLVSAAVGGVVSCRIKGEGGVGFSALVSLAIVIVMLIINVIACAGAVSLGAFMNYGCYMGVFCLCAYLGRRKRGHTRHRK